MDPVSLFWDNTELSNLEITCLKSYLANNHKVNLFTYKPDLTIFKHKNLNVIDANEIIEAKEKFYYKGHGDCPKNSVVGFSDIFRYELLYKVGGWYSDMDVINLKNLSGMSSYDIVLRPHEKYGVVSNICRFPKNYEPLKQVKKITESAINENNSEWSTPLKLFFDFVKTHGLECYIVKPELLGNDDDKFTHHILFDNFLHTRNSIKDMYCVHLCKSAYSTGNWNLKALCNFDNPKNMTLLHFLYYKYL